MPSCDWSIEKKFQVEAKANAIAIPEGLVANLLGDGEIQSTGVQGDARTYTPVIVLIGMFPGWATLTKVSQAITNSLPINRVIWMSACKDSNGEIVLFTGRCPKCFSADLYENGNGFGCNACKKFFPN